MTTDKYSFSSRIILFWNKTRSEPEDLRRHFALKKRHFSGKSELNYETTRYDDKMITITIMRSFSWYLQYFGWCNVRYGRRLAPREKIQPHILWPWSSSVGSRKNKAMFYFLILTSDLQRSSQLINSGNLTEVHATIWTLQTPAGQTRKPLGSVVCTLVRS